MYTGNYFSKEKEITVPLNYSGSTFSGDDTASTQSVMNDGTEETMAGAKDGGIFEAISSIFPIGRILPVGIRSALHLENFRIGTEELLIIALALFLFLSREGDKECAIILFLLLFIN